MDFSGLASLVANVGYPIAMRLILLFYMKDNDKKHDEEVSELRLAIENSTLVMQQLVDKLNS